MMSDTEIKTLIENLNLLKENSEYSVRKARHGGFKNESRPVHPTLRESSKCVAEGQR
jgi:hypothetical protein